MEEAVGGALIEKCLVVEAAVAVGVDVDDKPSGVELDEIDEAVICYCRSSRRGVARIYLWRTLMPLGGNQLRCNSLHIPRSRC